MTNLFAALWCALMAGFNFGLTVNFKTPTAVMVGIGMGLLCLLLAGVNVTFVVKRL